MDITQMLNSETTQIYINEMIEALKLSFPGLYESDLREAINYSIIKKLKKKEMKYQN